jgi:hypothetical protein
MLRKFVASGLVGLFLAMSLVVAQGNIGLYDRAADINGDGIVDIMDLTQVGQAYGSNYTLRSEANRTVVTVLSFDKDPPEVEGARVAVFVNEPPRLNSLDARYTNSSGIAVFELSPNTSYMAVGWNGSSYNYVDFHTDLFGEASVMILLGEPANPSIRKLPANYIFVTVLNRTTGLFHYVSGYANVIVERLWYTYPEGWQTYVFGDLPLTLPVFRFRDNQLVGNTGHGIIVRCQGQAIGSSTFQTDDDASANVIVYVPSSP